MKRQIFQTFSEAIRQNALTALARVRDDQAVALLRQAAAADSSEQVREWARTALLSEGLQ
jgi:HEAT repeat protein